LVACGRSTRDATESDSRPREAWNDANAPSRLLGGEYEAEFKKLALAGEAQGAVWTDFYWPDNRGGAAYRWRSKASLFKYDDIKAADARRLMPEEVALLSPLEKYDIYMGRYDFPSVKRARVLNASYREDWEGLCDAVAATGLNLREPGPVTVTSVDGKRISFGSSDLKALLAHYYGRVFRFNDTLVGENCAVPSPSDPDVRCRDVNPGAFHLLLANLVGREKKNFIADMTWDLTAWNHIVTAYHARVIEEVEPGPSASRKAKKALKIGNIVTYLGVADPTDERHQSASLSRRVYLEYVLELDADGAIVGGEWITQDHPDLAWTARLFAPRDYWAALGRLYEASVADLERAEGAHNAGESRP
jgi:hypothetical protein